MKALNLSTSLAAEDKDQYMTFMTIDYMSSEHSLSESEEGESNSEHGYESSDSERPNKESFLCKLTSVVASCTNSGHAQS